MPRERAPDAAAFGVSDLYRADAAGTGARRDDARGAIGLPASRGVVIEGPEPPVAPEPAGPDLPVVGDFAAAPEGGGKCFLSVCHLYHTDGLVLSVTSRSAPASQHGHGFFAVAQKHSSGALVHCGTRHVVRPQRAPNRPSVPRLLSNASNYARALSKDFEDQ